DLALIAVNLDNEVGVDVERICPVASFSGEPLTSARLRLAAKKVPSGTRDLPAIAKRFFSRQEQDWLFAQPEEQRLAGFYTIWTLKEAFLKVHGHGLGYPLDRFSVVPDLEGKWNLSAWTFTPDEGHRAALMLNGRSKTLAGFAFTPSLWPKP